jgi:hypothetical protein
MLSQVRGVVQGGDDQARLASPVGSPKGPLWAWQKNVGH